MLKELRKKTKLDVEELDEFLNTNAKSTKYFLEKNFLQNKIFRYLLLLRLKGVNLNSFFDEIIKNDPDSYKKWKK